MRGRKPIKEFIKDGHLTRGHSNTRLYGIWVGMKTRCLNPNDKKFSSYGGRGITICEEWKDDFPAFAKWSLENGYNETLTIDRINSEKGYSPENCRWVDQMVQQNNRRNNHRITFNGRCLTIKEWTRVTGLKDTTIHERLKKGWSVEDVLTRPVMSCSEAGEIGRKKRWNK